MTDYYWFGGAPGARTSDGYIEDVTGNRLANLPFTVVNAADGSTITDLLDQNGQPATQVTTDENGYYTFAAPATVVNLSGGAGTFRAYSSSAVSDVISALPQLDGIQASAAASALSARTAQAAAEAAASGATAPANAAIDTHLGGNATGLVTAVVGKVDKGSLFLNVRDYGAKGDGSTDDTAAIQSALDAAYAAAGSVVRVPRGTYKLTSRLILRANTTIDATGATLQGFWNNAGGELFLTNGVAADAPTGYAGNGNITILGGVWDSRGHLTAAGTSNGFAFAHADGITMRDVTIRNITQGHCVEINSSRRVRITGCRFEGYGSSSGSEAVQLDVAGAGGFPAFGSYDATPCDDVLMQGCTVGPSADLGAWSRGIGSHSGVIDRPMTNVRVIGNHFATTECAVRGYNWNDFTITGNTCVGGGIHVFTISTAITENTKLANGTQTSASVDCGPGVVAGNVVEGSALHSIWLAGEATGLVRQVAVVGNVVKAPSGAAASGIRTDYAINCQINSNSSRDATSNIISIVNSTAMQVIGNRTQRGSGHGINLSNAPTAQVHDNTLIEPGQHGISLSGGGNDQSIRHNTIIGASFTSNLTYNGIQVSTSTRAQVIGNKVTKGAGPNHAGYGINLVAAASACHHTLNDLRLSGTTASLNDTGTSSVTTAGTLL